MAVKFQIPFYLMPIAYSGTTGRTQESIQDVKGAIFLIIAEVIFTAIYRVANSYTSQIPILRREIHENLYHFSAYYFTEILTRMPYDFFFSYSALSIIYYFLGFVQSISLYLWFGLSLFMSTYTATAYGFMLSSFTEKEFLSAQISPPIDLIFSTLSGIYVSLRDFPYLRYISVFFYANESLSIIFWKDVTEIGNEIVYSVKSIIFYLSISISQNVHPNSVASAFATAHKYLKIKHSKQQ